MKKKFFIRTVAMLVCFMMIYSAASIQTLAYFVSDGDPSSQNDIVINGKDGSVAYKTQWNDLYPYGTFAFGDCEALVVEGATNGSAQTVIPVYRIGSTDGQATAIINYSPTVFAREDGTYSFSHAASAKEDIKIEYEEAQPIAKYQAVAMPPQKPAPDGVTLSVKNINSSKGTLYLCEGEKDLTADSYCWQYLDDGGEWRTMDDYAKSEITIDLADVCNEKGEFLYDYRCLYTIDGENYCTPTLVKKTVYNPSNDGAKTIPDGTPLAVEPSYAALSADNEFSGFEFKLKFAEGEWVKNIIVTALDNDTPELDELGVFAITESSGGITSEICNTLTVSVEDDDFDNIQPSQIGLKVKDYLVDQDAGEVNITVERIGDLNYMTSVHYETVNGSAIAGKQFTSVNGDVTLGGDEKTANIKVPLIAEEKRDKPLAFCVRLSNIRGGGTDGKCTFAEQPVATVNLVSSGVAVAKGGTLKSGINLATLLSANGAHDLTGKISMSGGSLLGSDIQMNVTTTKETAALQGLYSQSNTYEYEDGIEFRRSNYPSYDTTSEYWKDFEEPIHSSTYTEAIYRDTALYRDAITSPSFEQNSGGQKEDIPYKQHFKKDSQVELFHNSNTTAPTTLTINNASLLFSSVTSYYYMSRIGISRYDGTHRRKESEYRYVMPYSKISLAYKNGTNETVETNHSPQYFHDTPGGPSIVSDVFKESSKSISLDFSLDNGTFKAESSLILNKNGYGNTTPYQTVSRGEYANACTNYNWYDMIFRRRVLNHTSTLGMNLYSANDKDTAGEYAKLDTTTDIYKHLRPTVEIVNHSGGITDSGNLYVGSKLRVSLNNTATYAPYIGATNDATVFLTKKNLSTGIESKVNAKVEQTTISGKTAYELTMLWDDMNAADLNNCTYCLNVVVERKQNVSLNIKPSVDRDKKGDIKTDGASIKAAWDRICTNNDGKAAVVKFTVSQHDNTAPYFKTYSIEKPFSELADYSNTSALLTPQSVAGLNNIQAINFGLDSCDIILFNGRMFKGDEDIKLTMGDLSMTQMTFSFYDVNFLNEKSVMESTVSHTQLYYDGNGNGIIDGYFNEQTGYFTLDETSGDKDFGVVMGQLDQTALKPTVDSDGTVRQYFIKVFYTLTPRSIGGSDGKTGQILPAFITSLTDTDALSKLTSEQKSYRVIRAGATKINKYDAGTGKSQMVEIQDSSDGHPIYGAAATQLSALDVPLGGDLSDLANSTVLSDGKSEKLNIPEYKGNLRIPYPNPENIVLKDYNGTDKPINEKYTNDFLGAFINNSTYLLCVQESVQLKEYKDINPESVSVGNFIAIENGDQSGKLKGGKDSDSKFLPEALTGKNIGFGADIGAGIKLPYLSFSALGFDVTNLNGNQIMISFGIPVAKWTKNFINTTKERKEDGDDITEAVDSKGNTIKKRVHTEVDQEGVKKTTTTQTITSREKTVTEKDPKTGEVYRYKTYEERVMVVDPDGNVTYTNTTYTIDRTKTNQKGKITVLPDNEVSNHNRPAEGSNWTYIEDLLKNTGAKLAFEDLWGPIKRSMEGGKLFEDDSLNNAKKNQLANTKQLSFTVTLKGAILLEYNSIKGDWGIVKGSVGVVGALSFEIKHRFIECPLVYAFLRINGSIMISGDLKHYPSKINSSVELKKVNGNVDNVSGSYTLKTDDYVTFELDMSKNSGYGFTANGMFMNLNGKVNLLVSDSPDHFDNDHILTKGTLSSNGKSDTDVRLKSYDKKVYVRIIGRSNTAAVIKNPSATEYQKDEIIAEGLSVTPELTVEAGMGIGVEILKFEIFLKFNVKGIIKFAGYNPDTKEYSNNGAVYYSVGGGLDIRVKLIFFEFATDLVGGYREGTRVNTTDEWKRTSYWVAGGVRQNSNSQNSDEATVTLTPPKLGTGNQSLYAAYNDGDDVLNAYKPTDPDVNFELSGYGNSGDAFKLVDHVDTGGSYLSFSSGGDAYILYQLSDPACNDNALNQSQLALSKIVTTGDHPGIAHPFDQTQSVPYVFVDNNAGTDKATGIHNFTYSLNGDELTVTWTSYDKHFTANNGLTLNSAAENTVVKQATVKLDGSTTAKFSDAKIISNADKGFRFTPKMSGKTAFYGMTNGRTLNTKRDKMQRDYLKAVYGVTDEQLDTGKADAEHINYIYRYKAFKERDNLYGDGSSLVAYTSNGKQVPVDVSGGRGETITNIAVDTAGVSSAVFYTTEQTAYFDAAGNTIVDNFDENTDCATIRRMYLRTFDGAKWSDASIVRTVVDFDRCNNNNIEEQTLKDGVYSESALVEAAPDPTIANLKFLNADLDGTGSKPIFVFETSSNAYLIDNTSLNKLINRESAQIKPVFSSQMGSNITICSDSSGRLGIAYIKSMDSTTNTAIYNAWWDKETGSFGEGNLLAMNHMSVYENANKYRLNATDLNAAYLGKSTSNKEYNEFIATDSGKSQKGSLDEMVFSDLTMLAVKSADYTNNGVDTKDELVLITSGIFSTLKEETADDGSSENHKFIKKDKSYGKGYYAITFGSGKQSIGRASLLLDDYNITAGSQLSGSVRFTNTGSSALRGSAANPIKAELIAVNAENGNSMTICSWDIQNMIPSGKDLQLKITSNELTENLSDGTQLYLQVSEDREYIEKMGGEAFSGRSETLWQVGDLVELAVENCKTNVNSTDGNTVNIDIDFNVTNRGYKTSENVFLQFTYEGADGNYHTLDISNSELNINHDLRLEPKEVTANERTDLKNGLLYLYPTGEEHKKHGNDIQAQHYRTISGQLRVDRSLFENSPDDSGLKLNIEVFSDESICSINEGVYVATERNEFNVNNNLFGTTVDNKTFFTVPLQVCLSLGNVLRTVMSYDSTVQSSNIVVREISDGSDGWKPIIDDVYYDRSHSNIVATAKDVGTTVIQIEDKRTNSFEEITVIVTDAGAGTNIFKDDYTFNFFNLDGANIREKGVSFAWQFDENVNSWKGESKAPMNNDLCTSLQDGAWLSFDTNATTMTLWYYGDISVSSNLFTEQPVTASNIYDDTPKPLTLRFDNLDGKEHTITIKALKAGTQIDRVDCYYEEDTGGEARSGDNAPYILWRRSFPNTASLTYGEHILLTGFVVSQNSVQSVTVNGKPADGFRKVGDCLWTFDIDISENGTYKTVATADNNSTSVYTFDAHWFSDKKAYNTVSEAPDFLERDLTHFDENYQPRKLADLTRYTGMDKYNLMDCHLYGKHISYNDLKNGVSNWKTDERIVTDDHEYISLLNDCGLYVYRLADRYGAWTQVIMQEKTVWNNGDSDKLRFSVTLNDDEQQLEVEIFSLLRITKFTINGYSVNIGLNHDFTKDNLYKLTVPYTDGSLPKNIFQLCGDYNFKVQSYTNSAECNLFKKAVSWFMPNDWIKVSKAQDGSNTLDIDTGGKVIGYYDKETSHPEKGEYKSNVEYAILTFHYANDAPEINSVADIDAAGETVDWNWQKSSHFENVPSGLTMIAVRSLYDSENKMSILGAVEIKSNELLSQTESPSDINSQKPSVNPNETGKISASSDSKTATDGSQVNSDKAQSGDMSVNNVNTGATRTDMIFGDILIMLLAAITLTATVIVRRKRK